MAVIPIETALFWSKVNVAGATQCWLWQAARKGRGQAYGMFQGGSAHRYAYQTMVGPIPEGLMIRHKCGNKLCVNPRHLEPGTALENYNDRTRLGEKLGAGERGERNGRSKLTEVEVAYILANPELRGVDLADQFKVSKATISLIRSGRRWAHAA